ncbi:MAG TPA: PAS domain S-box protein [Alphaproteobacteria bacterium]|nr:PAS domain S-box protein [Alphaproteobacteria bacterium]
MTDFVSLLGQVIASRASEVVLITNGDLQSPQGPTIEYATTGILRTSGYEPRDLIGKRLGILFDEATMPKVLAVLYEAAETREPVVVEQEARRREGRPQWLELSTTPVFNESGRLTHFVRMSRDITARRRAEQHRETTQRLLASVFGVVKEPLAVADEAGRLIMANTAVTRRLGWSIFDLMGKPVSGLIAESDRPELDRLMSEGSALDQTRQIACYLLQKAKPPMAGEVEITSFRQPTGESFHILTLRESLRGEATERGWSLELEMREALNVGKAGDSVVAGKLQLVGLARVRESLGDKWVSVADRAFTVAERTIQRHLRPGDIFRRSKDDGFLVLFANLSATEAQFKADTISREICEKLTGEVPELAEPEVTSFAARVQLDDEALDGDEAIIDAIDRRLRAERERVEAASIKALTSGFKTSKAIGDSVVNDQGHAAPLAMVRLPIAMREAANRLRSLGRANYELEAETFLLAGAGERILAELARNAGGLVMTPVRFATLSQARELEVWLKVARTLGDAAKQKVVVEVKEVPMEVAATRLSDIAMRLSPLFKSIAVEIPVTDPAFQGKLPLAAKLATIDYRQIPWTPLGEPASPFQKLARALELRQRRLIVKDVPSAAKQAALAKAGVSLFLPPLA